MSQGHVDQYLSEYIDGRLSDRLANRVKSHLVFCNSCRHILNETQKIVEKLGSLAPKDLPIGLETRIIAAAKSEMKTLREGGYQSESDGFWSQWVLSARGLGLTGLAAVGLIIFVIIPKTSQPLSNTPSQNPIPSESQTNKNEINSSPAQTPLSSDQLSMAKKSPMPTQEQEIVQNSRPKADPALQLASNNRSYAGGTNFPEASRSQSASLQDKNSAFELGDGEDFASRNKIKKSLAAAPAQLMARSDRKPVETSQVNLDNLPKIGGQNSGITEPFVGVLEKKRDLKKLWKKHTKSDAADDPMPDFDFDKYQLLALFSGTQPTGGHSIEILDVENTEWEGDPARIVFYQVKSPPKNAMKTMALTQPYLLQAIPRQDGPIFFRIRR